MPRVKKETDKIQEALELLDQAAREKKEELYEALENQYQDFKRNIAETSSTLMEKVGAATERAQSFFHAGQEKVQQTTESAKETAVKVDHSVHEHPWIFMGSMALGAFLVGYGLSKSKNGNSAKH